MSQPILEKLFESPVRVKLLKLFLRNPAQFFDLEAVIDKTQAEKRAVKRMLASFLEIDLISERQAVLEKAMPSGRKSRRRVKVYQANAGFDFYKELRNLVLKSEPTSKEKILQGLKKLGRFKLVLISGLFLNFDNAKADMLLVGEPTSPARLQKFIKGLEAEAGKEITYVTMTEADFKYRHDMFDRFVRDLLEKPHEKLVNKLNI